MGFPAARPLRPSRQKEFCAAEEPELPTPAVERDEVIYLNSFLEAPLVAIWSWQREHTSPCHSLKGVRFSSRKVELHNQSLPINLQSLLHFPASSPKLSYAKPCYVWTTAWHRVEAALSSTSNAEAGGANSASSALPLTLHHCGLQKATLTFSLFSSCSNSWKESLSRESEWFLFRAGLDPRRLCYNIHTEVPVQYRAI